MRGVLHALLGHTVLGDQVIHGLGLDISMELENLSRGSHGSEGHVGKGFNHPVIACLEVVEEDCTCFMVLVMANASLMAQAASTACLPFLLPWLASGIT